MVDENQIKVKFSKMFLYLPSTLDRKEGFLKYKDHVHLHPVDISYDDITQMHNNEDANPVLLDDKNSRNKVTGTYYKVMKKVAEISNQNLLRNFDAYISSGGKIDPDNQFSWIDDLNASDLISLCYVSKYFRKLVLKFFLKVYDFAQLIIIQM